MSEPAIKLVAFCGSLRKGSFKRMALQAFAERLPAGTTLSTIEIGDWPLYNADVQAQGFPEKVQAAQKAVLEADGVVFASPEYNYSVSGVLKNAIDWLSRLTPQPFAGKPVAIQSATGGPMGGARMQYHMRAALVFLDAHVFNRPEIFVGLAQTKFDDKLELKDEATINFVKQQLAGFEKFIRKVNGKG